MSKFRDITVEENQVHFGSGVNYSELIQAVDAAGRALPNVPSLPHINVVGSMVTVTHGSGHNQPMLPGHVSRVEIVLADGSVKTVDRA